MSSSDKNRFYSLLPSVYRQKDIQQQTHDKHRPLQDLTAIMEETLKILENDIDGLYENWFIETCKEWVAPYIGDLVGTNLFLRVVKGNSVISGKAYVANTLHYRKRKGTVAIIEEMVQDVTGWDAHVVEFFQYLSTTQHINHVRPENQTPNIVNPDSIELVNTAFDSTPHTLDVRNIKNGIAHYNLPNLGIFLWRLTAYPVQRAQAFWHGNGRYSFSQIGDDIQLFNHPASKSGNVLSKEANVSVPIRRAAAKKDLDTYYGENRSIFVEVNGDGQSVDDVVICDLSTWSVPVEFCSASNPKSIAIDPVLGRLLLSDSEMEQKVLVTYYYGFNADMGGGFYQRDLYESETPLETYTISVKPVKGGSAGGNYTSISAALDQWKKNNYPNALFEIVDSAIYKENISNINIPPNVTLVLRSAQGQRATLSASKNTCVHDINIHSGNKSCFVLDGLLLNRNIRLNVVKSDVDNAGDSDLQTLAQRLIICNCTLVPPQQEGASIIVEDNDYLYVTLDKTISGPISMSTSKGQLVLKDSIIDKGSNEFAIQCFDASLENSTIFGKSTFDILTFASNTIFTDTVKVKRRQEGFVRFSYIPHRFEQGESASKIPKSYRCQPEKQSTKQRFVPRFTSEKYGSIGYAQLHKNVAQEIFEGADNESEMGAFNQTYQAYRINNLLSTFAEYLPFGLEAGVIIVT